MVLGRARRRESGSTLTITATPRGFRGALPEATAVFEREAAEMIETPGGRDIRDRLAVLAAQQRLAHPREAAITPVAHRRDAMVLAKMLEQRAARHAGGGD